MEAIIYDEHKCDAREWSIESINNIDYVLDNVQCQREKMNGSCFCKFHHKKNETMPNGWWLGKINEKRPEPLYHPGSKNHETGKYENSIQRIGVSCFTTLFCTTQFSGYLGGIVL